MKKLFFSLIFSISLSGLFQEATAGGIASTIGAAQEDGWYLFVDESERDTIAWPTAESNAATSLTEAEASGDIGSEAVVTDIAAGDAAGGGEVAVDASLICFTDPVAAAVCAVAAIVFVVVGCSAADGAYYFANDQGNMVCLNEVESW